MKLISVQAVQLAFTIALLCANATLGEQPEDPLAEARALLAAGQLMKSEASTRTYLRDHANSAEAHFLLGYLLFREQKARDSLAEFTAGAQVRRPNADELKTVASDYVLLGDFFDAAHWFSEVTSENPQDADAWYLLGRTEYNEGRYDEATSSFQRVLILHPRHVEAENNLGLCWRELNRLDQAKAAFQSAIDWQEASPSDSQPYLNLGAMLVDQDNFEAAIPLLSKAAGLSPDNPKIHEALGVAYEGQNNLPEAQAELERAVALAPKTSGLHFKLANLYRKEGLHDLAKQEFQICATLNSTHSSSETPNPFLPSAAGPH